jgi:hypothetical protein
MEFYWREMIHYEYNVFVMQYEAQIKLLGTSVFMKTVNCTKTGISGNKFHLARIWLW